MTETEFKRLAAEGFRVELDAGNEKVNAKIRNAQMQKVPYMLVVGDREAEQGTVSVRNRRHGDQGAKSVDDFVGAMKQLVDAKTPIE